MSFLSINVTCFRMLVIITIGEYLKSTHVYALETQLQQNTTGFTFRKIDHCKRNEYYNLDSFTCVPCNSENIYLEPTTDKFSCKCKSVPSSITIYDVTKDSPTVCIQICSDNLNRSEINKNVMNLEQCISPSIVKNSVSSKCLFKYINATTDSNFKLNASLVTSKHIMLNQNCINITARNCDLQYNFLYQDYCIANTLLKSYLKYNTFWQSSSNGGHHQLPDLKYVTFFCLALHNVTACNQLANLCIMSFYSFDKYSPCSPFLLAQASDAVMRYASMDLFTPLLKPSLFYKKSKDVAMQLAQPVSGLAYSLRNYENKIRLFHTTYALDGTLQRWGNFKLSQIDLCRLHTIRIGNTALNSQQEIQFAQRYELSECQLTLEQLIDLTQVLGNNRFINLFLNFTTKPDKNGKARIKLQAVPILIENLSAENQRKQAEEWQLVKRFQLIQAHARHFIVGHQKPVYGDEHKIMFYKQIRYVDNCEIHYTIHDRNHISVPIVKLHYHTIQLSDNSTLDEVYKFKMQITFERVGETNWQMQALNNAILPVLLLLALMFATFNTYIFRKRRSNIAVDCCDISCIMEFVLQFLSTLANAFLVFFILHILCSAILFLTQSHVEITLPIAKDNNSALQILIYAALIMKLIFFCTHLWRISHIDLFFIDWERPRNCDNNHFNLKSNLETSSVCSSVRTYVTDSNVSAWRLLFTANEWIRLCIKQKTSNIVRGVSLLIIFMFCDQDNITQSDTTLKLFIIIVVYTIFYAVQLLNRILLLNNIFCNPLHTFNNLCTLANISVLALQEPSYGFYVHGRSPHGFADTDMHSMIMQLQRESQNMCSRRGLLSDSDQQNYIVIPPTSLCTYIERLLIPFQRSHSISQAYFHKEANSAENHFEKTSIAYASVNRFFCAFIDHAIKDMDYIIKEKNILEKLFNCEFNKYLTENKGTFYIDNAHTFGKLCLYGNSLDIYIVDFLLIISIYMATGHLIIAVVINFIFNKALQNVFRHWVRNNVAAKTLIDKRLLF